MKKIMILLFVMLIASTAFALTEAKIREDAAKWECDESETLALVNKYKGKEYDDVATKYDNSLGACLQARMDEKYAAMDKPDDGDHHGTKSTDDDDDDDKPRRSSGGGSSSNPCSFMLIGPLLIGGGLVLLRRN